MCLSGEDLLNCTILRTDIRLNEPTFWFQTVRFPLDPLRMTYNPFRICGKSHGESDVDSPISLAMRSTGPLPLLSWKYG